MAGHGGRPGQSRCSRTGAGLVGDTPVRRNGAGAHPKASYLARHVCVTVSMVQDVCNGPVNIIAWWECDSDGKGLCMRS